MVIDVLTKGWFFIGFHGFFNQRRAMRRQASHDSKLSFINLVIHLTTQA